MSDLLGRLAERIATARSRAALSGEDRYITVTLPAEDVDPLALVGAVRDTDLAYWEQPALRMAVVGIGAAHRIEPAPDGGRFVEAAAEVRSLRSRTDQIALEGAERRALLLGGFSFSAEPGWPGFPSGRLTLPALALIREPFDATWMVAATVSAGTEPGELASELVRRLERAGELSSRVIAAGEPDHVAAARIDLRDPMYLKTVTAALDEIRAARLSKVVAARTLHVEHAPHLATFLATLRERYPTCATFAFRHGDRTFCGSTPERLVRLDGVSVSTAAVAGTAPRGADAAQDQVIADRLRHEPKEQHEHQFVIDEIRRRLAEADVAIDPQAATRVMRLPGLQHLYTPMGGTAPVGTSVLDMVGAMHPTPAVAGVPGPAAEEWIRTHEPFDRGWYAAPVGYCDLAGNGEFRVALRSGLIEGGRTTLMAGAGIVDGSIPERELEETGLKLGALLGSLLGS
jgi:isochorismate synthase